MKKLICIYTCEKDKKSLYNFKQTNLYKKLQNDTNTKILEVYAGSNKTQILGNKLLLDCEENYAGLSIKTYNMISECVRSINFDVLIKIDCNIFEYENTNYGFTKKIKHDLFNEEHITNVIFSDKLNTDYYGTALSVVKSFKSFQMWAEHKNIKLNCSESDLEYNVPFFAGKFYSCSRNFCEYISNKGESLADIFVKKLGGAEDVFMGTIHREFTNDKINLIIDYLIQCDFQNFTKETKRYLYNLLESYQEEYKKYELEESNCVNNNFFDEKKFYTSFNKLKSKIIKLKNKLKSK